MVTEVPSPPPEPPESSDDGAGCSSCCGAAASSCATSGSAGASSCAGSGSASGSGAAAPSPPPMTASSAPTSTVSSSATRILVSTPAAGDGISVSTLSVETSRRGSSTSTCSPSCLSQRVTVPSVTLSPRAGMVTDVGIGAVLLLAWGGGGVENDQPCTCRGLPASARWASPSASLCVGCGWMRLATSSASASQL